VLPWHPCLLGCWASFFLRRKVRRREGRDRERRDRDSWRGVCDGRAKEINIDFWEHPLRLARAEVAGKGWRACGEKAKVTPFGVIVCKQVYGRGQAGQNGKTLPANFRPKPDSCRRRAALSLPTFGCTDTRKRLAIRQWTPPSRLWRLTAVVGRRGQGRSRNGEEKECGEQVMLAYRVGLRHLATARTCRAVTLLAYRPASCCCCSQHAIHCEASVVTIPGGRELSYKREREGPSPCWSHRHNLHTIYFSRLPQRMGRAASQSFHMGSRAAFVLVCFSLRAVQLTISSTAVLCQSVLPRPQ
jgi:hypothetical protein